jgi:DNA-binding FadR family transcriptional regulator
VLPSPPPDAEVEDAAYVKLVALLRAGEVEAARLAARQYLRDFPNGFRREEVGRISRALPLTRPER